MAKVNRLGFTQLAGIESPGSDKRESGTVNIIFVHGLRGHPRETWTSRDRLQVQRTVSSSRWRQRSKSIFKSSSPHPEGGSSSSTLQESSATRLGQIFWPQDYLTKDITQARVWTYGYDADVIGGLFKASGKDSVSQHGRNLAVRLEREVDNEDPIIFVAHSLGGILVKDAIRRSEPTRKRTKLIVFLGTPHRGSGMAGWGQIASNLACLTFQDSHKKIIETLEVNNEVLDNIHEEFMRIIPRYDIRVHSFQEGRGISGLKGLHGKVVDDFSSKLDQPTVETVESINANHMQMARCQSRSDENYNAIAGVLRQFLKNSRPQMSLPVRTAMLTQYGEPSEVQQIADIPRSSVYYCNIPPRNRQFVGRTGKLNELVEKLIIKNSCRKLALVGLGGVGKTQVALELAYMIKNQRPDCSIFCLPAVSIESFEQACRRITNDCSISLGSTEDDPKDLVREYLSNKHAGKWLIIVDNADDEEIVFGTQSEPQGLADYLPDNENGLILFTTRYRYMAVSLAGKEVIDLEQMTDSEAVSFLRKSLIQEELLQDGIATAELPNTLTYLPLAIAQAAAYLNTIQISIREYILLLRNTEEDTISLLSREFRDETRYKGLETAKNAIATTWLISFDHIRRSDPVAADLLSFMACIEHKAIPRRMLPEVKPMEQTVHALGTLCAYAFITRQENGESYDMHRLVHLATRVWLREQVSMQDVNKKSAAHLAEIFPSDADDWSNRFIWRQYLPHVFRFLDNTRRLDIEPRYKLCLSVGECLTADGRFREAIAWIAECVQWRQSHFAEDHPERIASQAELANVYRQNGQMKEALALLERIVEIERDLAEDNPSRLESQYSLAITYRDNSQTKEAMNLLENIVSIQKGTLAEHHPKRLASLHWLAVTYRDNGQIKEAVDLLEYVVSIQKATLAEDHPDRLASLHWLAAAYRDNGQIKEAVDHLENIVSIQKGKLAENHPNLLASQHVLAMAYRTNGQTKEAVDVFEHVVNLRKETSAEDSAYLLASQHELGVAYLANGQFPEAVGLLEHVVRIRKRVFAAEDHPRRLASQQILSKAYHANGQIREAVSLLEHVVRIRKEVLAEDHPRRLTSQQRLSEAYYANGQIQEAVSLLEHVVRIRKEVLAEDDPKRLTSERILGEFYAQSNLPTREESDRRVAPGG